MMLIPDYYSSTRSDFIECLPPLLEYCVSIEIGSSESCIIYILMLNLLILFFLKNYG